MAPRGLGPSSTLARERALFLHHSTRGGVPGRRVPRQIARSWLRSVAAGVDSAGSDTPRIAVEADSRLARASTGPIDALIRSLGSIDIGVVLSDAGSRVLVRAVSGRAASHLLNAIDLAPGFDYSEAAVGTNGVGTVITTHQPVFVAGAAHYQERFLGYACAGAPVFDPHSGDLLGVLDLTCTVANAHPRMTAFATRAAAAIQEALNRHPERRGHQASQPGDIGSSAPATSAEATFDVVDAIAFGRSLHSPSWSLARRGLEHGLRRNEVTLVQGEVGTGKVSLVREVSSALRLADEPHVIAAQSQAASAIRALERTPLPAHRCTPLVVLRNAHQFSPEAIDAAAEFLRSPRVHGVPALVAITSEPGDALSDASPLARLLPYVARTVVVPPLRDRSTDFAAIVRRICDRVRMGTSSRISTEAIERLRQGHWPGNVHQLTDVLRNAVNAHPSGIIDADDLPSSVFDAALRPLTPVERNERTVIITALYRARGNRSAAARELGLSRATLYRKLAEFGLDQDGAGERAARRF